MTTERCSFCGDAATTTVADDSDIYPSCQRCAEAWRRNPGFTEDASNYFYASTCPCLAAERYVETCPTHGFARPDQRKLQPQAHPINDRETR